MRNLVRTKGGPNAPAATPQIGINFSRREGASPEHRRHELTNNGGEAQLRGSEKVRRAPTKVPPICDVPHCATSQIGGTTREPPFPPRLLSSVWRRARRRRGLS